MTTITANRIDVAPATETTEPSPLRVLGKALAPLAVDVAIPLGSYYLMTALGMGVVPALAVSGVLPALRTIYSVVRYRQTEPLALFSLVTAIIGIPVSLLTGSPRFMLAKESIGTGPLGVWVIVSALRGKPVMASAFRGMMAATPKRAAAWAELSATSAEFQRCLKMSTLVWGIGFTVEFVVRFAIVFGLPINTAIWATSFPMIACVIVCIVVAGRWSGRMADLVKETAQH
jgi:hypothetical protein